MDTDNIESEIIPINFTPYTYNDKNHVTFVRELIADKKLTVLTAYCKRHALYACVIPILTDHNDFIIKIGYSYNITKTLNTISKKYKSNVYLIKIMFIKNKQQGIIFQNILKTQFTSLIEKLSVNNEVDLYKLHPALLNIFDTNASEYNNLTPEEIIVCQNLKIQSTIFDQTISKLF